MRLGIERGRVLNITENIITIYQVGSLKDRIIGHKETCHTCRWFTHMALCMVIMAISKMGPVRSGMVN